MATNPTTGQSEQHGRCQVCGTADFISPDPTICGSCVNITMASLRVLFEQKRLKETGPTHTRIDSGPDRVAPPSPEGHIRPAGSLLPRGQRRGSTSLSRRRVASSASRAAGGSQTTTDRPNDASTTPTVTFGRIDGTPRREE